MKLYISASSGYSTYRIQTIQKLFDLGKRLSKEGVGKPSYSDWGEDVAYDRWVEEIGKILKKW